jgi:Sulfotransferase domain
VPVAPIVLWSVPRSGSTAFERMMAERGDHVVLSEPFSRAYYDGPEQQSTRFPVTAPDATVASVAEEVLQAAEGERVFVKDMAYHARVGATPELLGRFTNTFLIRDPAWSIPSFAAHWPDFTDDELGFDAVEALVDTTEQHGPVVLLDSDDLRQDPTAVIGAWCAAVGIPFDERALGWEPGLQRGWERWADWHEETARSSGFLPREPGPPPTVDDPRVADAIAVATPVYERLRAKRLRSVEA